VADEDLRRRLVIAIDGKGAFRRFKDVLLSYPLERDRWYAYRGAWLHWHINQWLTARRIITAEATPWGDVQPPPEPEALLPRTTPSGETLSEALRRRARDTVDVLPAGELPAALAFLEFLAQRGNVELTAARSRVEARRPPEEGGASSDDDDDSVDGDELMSTADSRP
jgi:hypothetical protein